MPKQSLSNTQLFCNSEHLGTLDSTSSVYDLPSQHLIGYANQSNNTRQKQKDIQIRKEEIKLFSSDPVCRNFPVNPQKTVRTKK